MCSTLSFILAYELARFGGLIKNALTRISIMTSEYVQGTSVQGCKLE